MAPSHKGTGGRSGPVWDGLFWSLWKTWWPFSCRSCSTHLDRICCRQHKKQACAAMWWSSMATPRIGGRCVQQLWPAPPILSISSAPCATPAPGRRPSGMLFAVGIAKDLRTEKITSRCKGWVIVICVAFFWLKKCALVLDPNFRMWRLCTTRWSMMGSSLWFCWKRQWSLRERLGFRTHVSLRQFCRKYLRQVGQEKLKPRKRSHEDPSQSLGEASSPLPSASRPAGTNSPADLQQLSDSTDLMSVTCSTHKESTTAQKQLKKSAGLLCACLSDGAILHMQEIYGCESLSQRYVCVAAVKALMPSLCVVVHDDACHLHKYAARRAKDRRVACLLLRDI